MYQFIFNFLLAVSLFNAPAFSFAADEEACPAVDFRERFGPLKNQGFHQICWAMSGSSLIEEEACLMDARYCGMNFSAVDMASCDPRIGHRHEENVVDRALQCAQLQGVCPEQLAPFRDFRMQQSLLGKLTMSPRFRRSPIFRIFDEYKSRRSHPSSAQNSAPQLELLQQEFLQEFHRSFPANDFTDLQLLEILQKAEDVVELLDRTLISNACKKKRVQFPGMGTVFTRIFPELNPRILDYYKPEEIQKFSRPLLTQQKIIVDRLKTGRSLGLSVCPEKFSVLEDLMIPGGDCIAGHAIVANALRRNPTSRVCEIHLMDSRKEASTVQFNGWFNLEEVAKATIAVTQIVPKKNRD